MKNSFEFTDIHGKTVIISKQELLLELLNETEFRFLGMSMREIREFRIQYLKKGGPLPLTVERIQSVFEDNSYRLSKKTALKKNSENSSTPPVTYPRNSNYRSTLRLSYNKNNELVMEKLGSDFHKQAAVAKISVEKIIAEFDKLKDVGRSLYNIKETPSPTKTEKRKRPFIPSGCAESLSGEFVWIRSLALSKLLARTKAYKMEARIRLLLQEKINCQLIKDLRGLD